MRLLCIEACTETLSVAIFDGDELVAESVHQRPERHHSVQLLASVDHIISAAGWSRTDITDIAATRGPGSFTSVRITLAAAWGLAYSLKLPMWCESTLATLAKGAAMEMRSERIPILSAIDARRNEVYWALYSANEEGILSELIAPRVGSVDSMIDEIFVEVGSDALLRTIALGSGAKKYSSQLADAGIGRPSNFFLDFPRAAMLGKMVIDGDLGIESSNRCSPLYLRKSQAERNAEANEGVSKQ